MGIFGRKKGRASAAAAREHSTNRQQTTFQRKPEEVAAYLVDLIKLDGNGGSHVAYEFVQGYLDEAPDEMDVGVFAPLTWSHAPSSRAWFGLLVARVAGPTFSEPADDEKDYAAFAVLQGLLRDAQLLVGGAPISRQPIGDLFYRVIEAWSMIMAMAWTVRFGEWSDDADQSVGPPALREFLSTTAGWFADGLLEQATGSWRAEGVTETLTRLDQITAKDSRSPLIEVLDGRQPSALITFRSLEDRFPDGFISEKFVLDATGDEILTRDLYAATEPLGCRRPDEAEPMGAEDADSRAPDSAPASQPESNLLSWPGERQGLAYAADLDQLSDSELLRVLELAEDEVDAVASGSYVGLSPLPADDSLASHGWVSRARTMTEEGLLVVTHLTSFGRNHARLLTALGDIPCYAESLVERIENMAPASDSVPFDDDIPF